jgi:hypothetical protein
MRCIYVRLICGVVGILAAAVLAGPLYAVDLPTPPPVTLPVTVPPVPIPQLPLAPPPGPTGPIAPATPATPATPASSTNGAAPAPAPSGGSFPSAPVYSSGTSRAHGSAKRPFRPIVKRFRLAHAGRVRVTVREVYPVCKKLHSFVFAGQKGRNVLRLPKRIVKRIGTYQLVAHAHGHKLFSVRARVLHGRRLLINKGNANACDSVQVEAAALTTPVSNQTTAQEHHGVASAHEQRSALPQGISHAPRDTNPLVRAITLSDAPASIRPLLFVLLAMSILLLGTAAMPQTVLPAGPMAGVLAQRRIYLAVAGIWLLAVVVVVTLIS